MTDRTRQSALCRILVALSLRIGANGTVTVRGEIVKVLVHQFPPVRAAGNPHNRVLDLVVLRRFLLRLHLDDIELLRGIGAQDGGLAFQDFHDQQAGLAVYLLDRTLEEHLQQLVETIQIERDDPQLRSVIDLGQRTIEPPGPAKKSSRPSFEAPRSIIGG